MKHIATLSFADFKEETRYSFKRGSVVPPSTPKEVVAEWLRLGFIAEDNPPLPIVESLLAAEDLPGEGEEAAVKPKPKGKRGK